MTRSGPRVTISAVLKMAKTVALPDGLYDELAADARRLRLRVDELAVRLLARRRTEVVAGPQAAPQEGGQPWPLPALTPEAQRFLDDFVGTWKASPGFDAVELVRGHDD